MKKLFVLLLLCSPVWGADTMMRIVNPITGVPIDVLYHDNGDGTYSMGIYGSITVEGTDITEYGSSAVGADNAIHVQPGTGATWAVTQSGEWDLSATLDNLPAANLGQQAMAASLSIVPANNITDATYIGDIKFGEALPTGTNVIGGVNIYGSDGTARLVKTDSGGAIQVDVESGTVTATATDLDIRDLSSAADSVSAVQSGTWTVQPGNTANTTAWLVTGTGGTFPATQSGNWSVRLQDGSGNAVTSTASALDVNIKSGVTDDPAEGAAATSTDPVIIGGQAESTEKAAVDDGDASRLVTDLVGKLVTSPHAVSDYYFVATGDGETGTTEEVLLAASESLRYYITSVVVSNEDADTSTAVLILDGASGSTLARIPAPMGGGAVWTPATPIPLSAVNKAVVWKAAAAATTVYVTVTGFKSAR